MLAKKWRRFINAKMLMMALLAMVSGVCFSQYTPTHQMVRVGNVITFKGNKIEVIPERYDTIIVTDPVTGKDDKTLTMRAPLPDKVNGVQIIDEVNKLSQRPVFKSADGSFSNYLLRHMRKDLEQLPDGSYHIELSAITVGISGDLVYYSFAGISKSKLGVGGNEPIPGAMTDKINHKIEDFLYTAKGKPAKLAGNNVPVLLFGEKLIRSIDIKHHKITNW